MPNCLGATKQEQVSRNSYKGKSTIIIGDLCNKMPLLVVKRDHKKEHKSHFNKSL